jgi:SNF2 family DNA or RNA helicase
MIFDALLKLRQICCDPRLVKLPAAEALVKKGHAHSAKLATLMEMLVELLDEGRKVLLFSQFTSMLELIEPSSKSSASPMPSSPARPATAKRRSAISRKAACRCS